MAYYKYTLAQEIQQGDRLLVCSVWYEAIMVQPRSVGGETRYIQIFLRPCVEESYRDTDITIVFPMMVMVKVKSRSRL